MEPNHCVVMKPKPIYGKVAHSGRQPHVRSEHAQGVSGPSSSCVWNPRVFVDDARGWQCPFVLCLHPAFPAHLRMRPVSRGNSRRATWVGPHAERAYISSLLYINKIRRSGDTRGSFWPQVLLMQLSITCPYELSSPVCLNLCYSLVSCTWTTLLP